MFNLVIMRPVATSFNEGGSGTVYVNQIPDKCPLCHHAIEPVFQMAFCDKDKWEKENCLQVVCKCTRDVCRNLFIAYYKPKDQSLQHFYLQNLQPRKKEERNFSETIKAVSSSFCLIYNQASSAEADDLSEICGVGYRKALEFLIKDYLIKLYPEKKENIEKKYLGNCIEEDILNDNIKKMAKRATWLGNDETHYLRKWQTKDLSDLKKLIDATLYWIEIETLTKDSEIDMPESPNK